MNDNTKPICHDSTAQSGLENTKARKVFVALRGVVIAWLCLAVPRAAFACPVCFGDSNSPMASATNMGILAMLIVVVGVLVAFASFFIYLMRRAKLAGNAARPADGRTFGEGTARC